MHIDAEIEIEIEMNQNRTLPLNKFKYATLLHLAIEEDRNDPPEVALEPFSNNSLSLVFFSLYGLKNKMNTTSHPIIMKIVK